MVDAPRTRAVEENTGPFQLVILALSIYVLAALVAEALFDLPADVVALLSLIDDAICVIFLADFFIRYARARSKREFLRWGWIDFVSSIPGFQFLRWGRAVRVIRLIRILRAFRSVRVLFRYTFRNRARGTFATVSLIAIGTLIFSSIAVLYLERGPAANIRTPSDALWWSISTVTTVGYGDKYPVTPEGKLVAVVLMTAGIAFFGAFTALLATVFIEPRQREENAELMLLIGEVRELRARIETLAPSVSAIEDRNVHEPAAE